MRTCVQAVLCTLLVSLSACAGTPPSPVPTPPAPTPRPDSATASCRTDQLPVPDNCPEIPEKTDPVVDVPDDRFPVKTWPDNKELNDAIAWNYPGIAWQPGYQYTREQKLQIMEGEKGLFPGSRLGKSWLGGMAPKPPPPPPNDIYDELDVPLHDHPKASLPLPVEEPTVTTPPSIGRSGPSAAIRQSYSNHFGNELFGAGYTGFGDFTVNSASKMSLDAEADTYATVFSFKQSIARYVVTGGLNCGTGQPLEAKVTARAFLLGVLVDERSWEATTSKSRVFGRTRDFFKANRRFMVGPVPLNVTATVKGEVGLDLKATLACSAGLIVEATPFTKLNVKAEASVSVIVASFGTEGNLNLIDVELPRTATLKWDSSSKCAKTSFTVDRNVTTLNGNLGLFAQIKFLFYKKRWNVTIAKWSGVNWKTRIVDWTNSSLCPSAT